MKNISKIISQSSYSEESKKSYIDFFTKNNVLLIDDDMTLDDKIYASQIIHGSIEYKFVEVAPKDNWSGNWQVGGKECFLALLKKKKNGYFIYCTGTDDFDSMKQYSSKQEAMKEFKRLVDGISIKKTVEMGIIYY